jgi:hypothetical protein
MWRVRFWLKFSVALLFLTWTFWFMPRAASHQWPFR